MSELGRFPVSIEVPVAWGDMDAFLHVNNVVYLRWFESARIAYFERCGLIARMKTEGVGPILAKSSIDYRIPLTYPDTVRAATTVSALGKTSFTMDYKVTRVAHPGEDVATGSTVIVLVDYRKGGKVPLDEGLRRAILALEATAAG
jgi:acyl-CoA thioester hydrolase